MLDAHIAYHVSFAGEEISNLDAISLSNCPKLSDNPRIKTVEYTVAHLLSDSMVEG